jgi:hypothetical protein
MKPAMFVLVGLVCLSGCGRGATEKSQQSPADLSTATAPPAPTVDRGQHAPVDQPQTSQSTVRAPAEAATQEAPVTDIPSNKKKGSEPGGEANGHPTLSDLKIISTKTSPITIKFSLRITSGESPISFGRKSGLWYCLGQPSTIEMKSYLEKQINESKPSLEDKQNVRMMGSMDGPGFVAASSWVAKSADNPDVWTGNIAEGGLKIEDDRVIFENPRGTQSFELTNMPISWLLWDDNYHVSNELKAIVDLKAGKLVKIIESSR